MATDQYEDDLELDAEIVEDDDIEIDILEDDDDAAVDDVDYDEGFDVVDDDVDDVIADDVVADADDDDADTDDDTGDEAGEAAADKEPVAKVADDDDDDDDVVDLDDDDDDEDEETLEVLLGPDTATATTTPRARGDDTGDAPPGEGEFTCRSCFLVKRRAQLADGNAMICLDCAA